MLLQIASFTASVERRCQPVKEYRRPRADGVCSGAGWGARRVPSHKSAARRGLNHRPLPQDQKERPLKLAERNTPANRKPAFWSSKIHGIPQNYKPREASVPQLSRPGRSDRALAHRTTAIKAKPKDDAALVVASKASLKLIDTVTSELKRKVRCSGGRGQQG